MTWPFLLEEIVRGDRAVWQSDSAKSYYCEQCHRWVRTQYEGEKQPKTIICEGGISGGHRVQWDCD